MSKFKEIFDKLGVKYNIKNEEEMRKEAGPNTAGYYDTRNDIINVSNSYTNEGPNDGLKSMGIAVTNYIAMHELIHWTGRRVGRIWTSVLGAIFVGNHQNANMLEEVVAESGGEKLEKDLMHEDVSRGVAERLDVFVTHGMPTRWLDEGIKEGEEAAEYVEKELQNARLEPRSV